MAGSLIISSIQLDSDNNFSILSNTGTTLVSANGSGIIGGIADGSITPAKITGTLTVSQGGTGANTLTGYVKGSGTSAMTASATVPTSDLTGTLGVANGGTGATSLTANNVVLGNGTSAVQVVAPGTSGNVLTSNGTTWTSTALPAGGVTSLNGQTGAITNTNVDAIGSYISAIAGLTSPSPGGTTTYSVNGTIAGSSLRYNFSGAAGISSGYSRYQVGGVAIGYNGGGTALSGTWRWMSSASIVCVTTNPCDNGQTATWNAGLLVRIS